MSGLLFAYLWSVVLHICIGQAVVAVVSCSINLFIVLSYPLGVTRFPSILFTSIGTTMQIHMELGGSVQGLSFRVIVYS